MTPPPIPDETGLRAWLADATGAGRVDIHDVRRLGGGAISINLAMELEFAGGTLPGRHGVVLRTGSASGVSASLGKAQEAAVLKAAFAAGVAVPEPLFVEPSGSVLGAPFYIMRRAGGVAVGHRIVKSDRPQTALAHRLGQELARLHAVRPGTAGLEFLSLPNVSAALDGIRCYREWLGPLSSQDPVLAYGLRWLERHAPPAGEIVLSHRDFRTGNYLVADGQLTAIIDWEFAGWSDPMEDIGWFCATCWRFGRRDREAGGLADRDAFYSGYESQSGRRIDRDAVGWWEVAAHMRWAAIAAQQAARHVSGAEPSLELALTGRMLPEIQLDMLNRIGSLETACA